MIYKHFYKIIFAFLFTWSFFPKSNAQSISDSKHITRSLPVSRETSIEVSNKYGNITIETWNYDSVKFVIVATASADKAADASLSLSNIDFQFINTSNYVMAKTLFINPTRAIINDLKSIFSRSNNMNIDYKIYVPKTVNLKLDNKFGDIFAGALEGSIAIKQAYGNLKIFKIEGQLKTELNYVDNAEIDRITRGICQISFSHVYIKNAVTLDIKSSASKIEINQVEDLQLESLNDETNIFNVANAELNTKFSKTTIESFGKSFIGNTRFGTLTFRKLNPGFSKINIGARYTDMNIFFDTDNVGFDIEIDNQRSRLMYPRMYNLKEETVNPKEAIYRTIGHIGKASDSKIYIDAVYGNINLKMK